MFLKPPEPPSGGELSDVVVLAKTLLTGVSAADGVEHVAALTGLDGIHVGLFSRSADPESALCQARRRCEEMIDRHAAFAGWYVEEF